MTYVVNVTREGDAWLADVRSLPGAHTFARNLTVLRRSVREVIALVADLSTEPDDASIEYIYDGIDDELAEAVSLGRRRAELERQQRELATESAARIEQLTKSGYSVRDISAALMMSPGRVSQIAAGSRTS
jgi:predicted RNase H-like HicB family nuclease